MSKHLIPWKRKAESVPVKREEGHPFWSLHRQMNELFDDFFSDFGDPARAGWPAVWRTDRDLDVVSPCVDVAETDDAIQVTAELPGMDEKDIEVTLDRNALTVKGEKKQEREEKKKNYYFSERSYGRFQRVVPLPEGINRDMVKAQFKKGVLSITVPKTEQAKAERKRIEIVKE